MQSEDNVSQAYGRALLESIAEEQELSSHEKLCWIHVYTAKISAGYSADSASLHASIAVKEFKKYLD